MNFGIIAAGDGSRLAGEGVEKPKPLVELCGVPMIGRLLGILDRVGAERIAVIVNGRMPEVALYLEEQTRRFAGRLTVTVKNTLPPCTVSMRYAAVCATVKNMW